MKSVCVGLVVIFSVILSAQDKPKAELSEVQNLKAQVLVLKSQLLQVQTTEAQCRATLADVSARYDTIMINTTGTTLQEERKVLEADLLKTLGGRDTDTIDWTTTPPSLKKADADKK